MKEYNGVGGYLRDAVREKFLRDQGQQEQIQFVTYGGKTAQQYVEDYNQQISEPEQQVSMQEEDAVEKRKRILEEAFNRL